MHINDKVYALERAVQYAEVCEAERSVIEDLREMLAGAIREQRGE